jgi:hypothetical protein
MAASAQPGNRRKRPKRAQKDFWERWWTRATVCVVAFATVVAVVVFGDPEHESWQTKTHEFVHGLVTKTHDGDVKAH